MYAWGGSNDYFPFIWLAENFGIPWFVFSDGEDLAVAGLQAAAKRAGVADIAKCDHIVVIPEKRDFEAHLMHDGYLDAFEAAISAYAGATALEQFIAELDGKDGKKFEGKTTKRDYKGAGGRSRAALDMVSGKKTRYAVPLANAIIDLADPKRRVPKLVAQLFDVIGTKFGIKKLDPTILGNK